jgi:hypothetical protein
MNTIIEKSSARVDAAEIRFTIERLGRCNERNYRYAHLETGRQFTASRLAQARRRARFFLSELIPERTDARRKQPRRRYPRLG